MWVFITDSAKDPEITLSNERAGENTGFADDPELAIIPEIIGWLIIANEHAVGIKYLLANVTTYNIGVVAGFSEVIILLLGAIIREIEGGGKVPFDDLFVGFEGVKVKMKHFYMVSELD